MPTPTEATALREPLTRQLVIRISEDDYRDLGEEAARADRSLAWVARQRIREGHDDRQAA
jgi:hypothetical protein